MTTPANTSRVIWNFTFRLAAARRVQRHRTPDERLERRLVELLAFTKVDGTPRVALEAGVEEPRGVLHLSPFEKRQLHHALIGLARAYQSVVRPDRDAPPLPFLDDSGVGVLDQGADPGKCLAAPVTQFLDPRVDQPRRRLAFPRHVVLLLHSATSIAMIESAGLV